MTPPGFRTRMTSDRTALVSGTCMRTAWQWAASKELSSKGSSVTSPTWNVALPCPPAAAAARARPICDSSMSMPCASPGSTALAEAHRDGPRAAAEVENAEAGLEMRHQMRGMGLGAAAVEKLEEFLAIAHRVAGRVRCPVSHCRALLSGAYAGNSQSPVGGPCSIVQSGGNGRSAVALSVS